MENKDTKKKKPELRELPFCKYKLFLISVLLFGWTQTLRSTSVWRKAFKQFLKERY